MGTNHPQQNSAMIFLNYVASIVGMVIGWYCGVTLFFPAIGIVIVVVAAKLSPIPRLQPFVSAIAAQGGLALFMLAGGIMHPGGMKLVIYDLAVLAIGLGWLMVRPGLLPVLLLGIYELFALFINIDRISSYEFGSVPHKGIVATIALRVGAVIALIIGYVQFRKNEAVRKESESNQSLQPNLAPPP